MIRPNPFIISCKKCHYCKVVHPKSDALSPSDFIQRCPECQTLMTKKEILTLLDKMKLLLFVNFKNT